MLIGLTCLFHWLTGWYCPGCGGTRSVNFLLHGQIQKSIQFHPFVLYIAVVFVAQMVSRILVRVVHNGKPEARHLEVFAYIGIGIILINFLVKNYMLLIKGIDLLK